MKSGKFSQSINADMRTTNCHRYVTQSCTSRLLLKLTSFTIKKYYLSMRSHDRSAGDGCQYSRYYPWYLYTDDTPLFGSTFDLCGV